MKSIWVLILCLTAVVLCFFMSETIMTKKNNLLSGGHIIYAYDVNGVITFYSMDLSSKKIKKLYGKQGSGGAVSKIDSNWLLFGIDDSNNKDIIIKFNIKTGEAIYLRRGSTPIYIPSQNKILFLLFGGGDLYGLDSGLYVANMSEANKFKLITECPTQHNKPVQISYNEVVFRSGEEKDEVSLYNVKTNKTKLLPIKDCTYPLVWREKTKQLIYFDSEKNEYLLNSLDGKHIEKLPFKEGVPLIYVPDKDVLIVSVEDTRDFSPVWDLWAYDFATGKKELLSRSNGFHVGGGIYLPE